MIFNIKREISLGVREAIEKHDTLVARRLSSHYLLW